MPALLPCLRAIEGHRGAYLLRRAVEEAVELVVLTLWESMGAVRKFAGVEPEKAVIEPEARAMLTSCDESVTHFTARNGRENELRPTIGLGTQPIPVGMEVNRRSV